jgi:hypothetical protein
VERGKEAMALAAAVVVDGYEGVGGFALTALPA